MNRENQGSKVLEKQVEINTSLDISDLQQRRNLVAKKFEFGSALDTLVVCYSNVDTRKSLYRKRNIFSQK